MKFAAFLLALVLMIVSGCTITSAPAPYPPYPDYPGGGPGPGQYPQDAMNALADSLNRMFAVLDTYSRDNYPALRAEMRDMARSVNDVQRRMQDGQHGPPIRAAFDNVRRDADTIDARVRTINPDRPIRDAWRYVRDCTSDASDAIERYENPGPFPPGRGGRGGRGRGG